ncbi:glycosyltransferase family 2 protein [Palleronia sediminis]|uniref:glycosyltransferase family 2 protein n=1 Tax=Palleronia sediminis TaxID=2547833 RepID=UPI001F11492E|nr:glycosyltransferase family 2 protein [Palleronia sediminis]
MDRTRTIAPDAILCFLCVRNEAQRLPWFLRHTRALGVAHFLAVDNDSTDGTAELLAGADDVSLWRTGASYRLSRFGLDWLTWLMIRHGHGHWCLTLDADELLVYPNWPTRPLQALTEWLDASGREMMGALMLDLYPRGPVGDAPYAAGDDPTDILHWFDAGNHMIRRQAPMGNLWVQGGPRARAFFAAEPRRAPTLQKVPLVKWNRRYVYVNSTHAALPRRLNAIYDETGGEEVTGLLLHTKFLDQIVEKSQEELMRGQHFANSALYTEYYRRIIENPTLWTPRSTRLRGWRHLEALGLMSRGGWI